MNLSILLSSSSKSTLPKLLLIAVLLAGCQDSNQNSVAGVGSESRSEENGKAELVAFSKAIRAKYDMKEQAFRDNDPEPILTRFYSEDAISTDNEGITHIGRAELRPIYEEVIGAFVKVESYKTFVNGDAGWDWVNFHVSFPPDANMEPFTFKMLFLWERIDGEWWSHGEMYVLGEFDIQK